MAAEHGQPGKENKDTTSALPEDKQPDAGQAENKQPEDKQPDAGQAENKQPEDKQPDAGQHPQVTQHNKGNFWIFFGVTVIIVFGGVYLLLMSQLPGEGAYAVGWDGKVSYTNRPAVQFQRVANYSDGNVTVDKLYVQSKGVTMAGLLAIPKNSSKATNGTGKLPVFIVIPGAGTSKEGEHNGLSTDLNGLGFATLTIDLRGSGETGGELLPADTEIQLFREGKEPPTHQSFYDVLRAFDGLAVQTDIDPARIAIIGESMGGRYAIIAGWMEPRITGVVAISTAGHTFRLTEDDMVNRFLASVNPNTYIDTLGRPFLLLHSINDPTVPVEAARNTYALARDPREAFYFTKPGHGYDKKEMMGWLEERIAGW